MELPQLEKLWKKYREKGLSVIAIESRRDRDLALKFIQRENLSFHLLENQEGERDVVNNVFEVPGYPMTLVINSDSKVLYSHLGFSTGDEVKLEKEIVDLLNR